jgi:hypothetical protein
MRKAESVISWLFDTPLGNAVGILLVPFGLMTWGLASLALGENLFESRLWTRLEDRKIGGNTHG